MWIVSFRISFLACDHINNNYYKFPAVFILLCERRTLVSDSENVHSRLIRCAITFLKLCVTLHVVKENIVGYGVHREKL